MRYTKTRFYNTGFGVSEQRKIVWDEEFHIIEADTYNRKGVAENIVFVDTEARNAYNALLRYRRDNPDGKYLTIEQKKYGRRKRWTLSLGGKEYVAEKISMIVDDGADRERDTQHWYIDETCNWKDVNDGWN